MIQARTGVVRILLLEDSALDAELIEVQLAVAKLSFSIDRVWTLDGFEEAVKSGRHDIILSDHLLLGFDGHDALKIARREAADLPFIFVSGTLSDELAVEALKQGARDFVVKQRLQRLPDAIVRALKENDESKKLAQAERELRRSREQLIVMADALPALIAHVGPDHRYRFGNDAHARWFGIAPDLLTGKHVADVVGEKAFKGAEGDLAKVLAGQRTVIEAVLLPNLEAPVRYAQIDCVPEIDASGRVAGYYMLARDVTEQKNAELSLKEANSLLERQVRERTAELDRSQRRLAAIFESSFQLQILLGVDGLILDANAAALSAGLVAKEDVAGVALERSVWFSATPGVPDLIRSAFAEALSAGPSRREIELFLPTGTRHFDVSLRPLQDSSSETLAVVLEAVETTARRQAEHALRQSQKIEAIGQLTGGIAHDFNNILTIIAGSTELAKVLMGNQGSADRATRALDNALKGVASAAALTHRLLAFARRQPLKTEPVDCNGQIFGMKDMLNRTLGELVSLRLITQPGLWNVEVDAAQLEAAILNLAVNARDAMPSGGHLSIETSNTRLTSDDAGRMPDLSAGEYVMVRVKDSGHGMTAETLSRVFEPFFTTKDVGRGTGLGLPMVYGFVKQSMGHILMESTVGAGTTLTMFFPRTLRAVEHADFAVADLAENAPKDATVLVAEDNDDVRAYVVEVLRELGYRVLEAHDGFAALRLVERPDVEVDLLFSDIVMPGMAGWELAQKAKLLQKDLCVLFTSGYPRHIEENEQAVRDIGILAKPYSRSELVAAIAAALEVRARQKASLPTV